MATLKIVFRSSVKEGRNPGSLSLRVIHGRKPRTLRLSCYLYTEEWNAVDQTIVYPANDSERTAYLQEIESTLTSSCKRMRDIIRELEQQGYYSVTDIVNRFHLPLADGNLLAYVRVLAGHLCQRKQKRLADAYMTVSRGLVKFCNKKDIPLSHIHAPLVRDFEAFLKDCGKRPNTISYYMRNLRAIYNRAVASGHIKKDEKPFSGVFTGVEETRKRAMNAREVCRLQAVDFDALLKTAIPKTRQYRHLLGLLDAQRFFFFCLFAQGMCFVDMCYLKKANVYGDVIRYYRKKTGKQIEVPVNDGMRYILDSFAERTDSSQYLFPILRDDGGDHRLMYETALRTQNRRLKHIGAMVGMEKGVTTHVARHSWASILKNKMQPLSVISEGLGHSSEKMTRKYLDSFERSVLGEAGQTLLSALTASSGGLTDGYGRV